MIRGWLDMRLKATDFFIPGRILVKKKEKKTFIGVGTCIPELEMDLFVLTS